MFVKGFTYGFDGIRADYRSPEAIQSMEKLRATGAEWICIAFIIYQNKYSDTEIMFDYRDSVTDKDLQFAIAKAHELGMKVCLKPVLNSRDGLWRALINFPDSDMMGKDVYWEKWFEYYTAFMCHYAELATDTACEMLCIGCEMSGTERKEALWRRLIKKVRGIYDGTVMYNTNHGNEDKVNWFDAVDLVGTSAYYPVEDEPGDTEENMYKRWQPVKERMKALSEKWGKQIIFAEIGCRSARGCAMMPWDFTHSEFPHDEDEQANFYNSCLRTFFDEPWFAGYFWWDWSTKVYDAPNGKNNNGFDIYDKKAEEVIRTWYGKTRE